MEDSILAIFLLLMIESILGRKGHIYFTAVSPGKPGIDAEAWTSAATECSTDMPVVRSYESILSVEGSFS